MGRDHSVECERCGAFYGGMNGPDQCPCGDLYELCPICQDNGDDCVWCEDSGAPGYVVHDCLVATSG